MARRQPQPTPAAGSALGAPAAPGGPTATGRGPGASGGLGAGKREDPCPCGAGIPDRMPGGTCRRRARAARCPAHPQPAGGRGGCPSDRARAGGADLHSLWSHGSTACERQCPAPGRPGAGGARACAAARPAAGPRSPAADQQSYISGRPVAP